MQYKTYSIKKISSGFMLCVLCFAALAPAARADVPVFDSKLSALLEGTQGAIIFNTGATSLNTGSLVVKEFTLDTIAWFLARQLIHQLSQQFINWIKNDGNPRFVQDWETFLLSAADQASGSFLQELNLTSLCEPFGLTIKLALGVGRRPFHERYRCNVSGVIKNIQNFLNDFSNGGWRTWFEITQIPQHNPYEAYLLAIEEKTIRERLAASKNLNEALSANGFLGLKKCENESISVPGEDPEQGNETVTIQNCRIVTPGKAIEEKLAEIFKSDINQLGLADEINEILLALFQRMMQQIFYSGGGIADTNINSFRGPRTDEVEVNFGSPSDDGIVGGDVPLRAVFSGELEKVERVTFTLDGDIILGELGPDELTNSIIWDTTGVPNGEHTITIVAMDANGNVITTETITVIVDNLAIDTSTGLVSITEPRAGQEVSGVITITASASPELAVKSVTFLLDGDKNIGATRESPYSIEWSTTRTRNGEHTLRAQVKDVEGNKFTSPAVKIKINNPPGTGETELGDRERRERENEE